MRKPVARLVSLLTLILFGYGPLGAAPWIQQNRWMLLGPIENPAGCYNDVQNPPVPDHSMENECPRIGEDWKGEAFFVDGADTTTWKDLGGLGVGPGDVVNLDAFYRMLQLKNDLVKALAVIYAVNKTPRPIQVGVCTASDDGIKVWINDRLVTSTDWCSSTTCDCTELNPGVLLPGKNKIAVCSWDSGLGWSFRLRLSRSDGTTIDDSNDPDVEFTLEPDGCLGGLPDFRVFRDIEGSLSGCSGSDGRALVRLQGSGDAGADDLLTVEEFIQGQARASSISHGGVFTPAAHEQPCGFDQPTPVGIFTEHRDLGIPCAKGTTAFDSAGGSYAVTGGGEEIGACPDQLQFAFREVRGDFTLTARIAGRDWGGPAPPSRWGRMGLMVREDCTARSRFAFIHDSSPNSVPPTPAGSGPDPDGVRFTGRGTHGGSDNFEGGIGVSRVQHPDFLRLERRGSAFTGYASADGTVWTAVHSVDWGSAAPCACFVGLAVSSHAGCTPVTILFDRVDLVGGEAACPPPPSRGGKIRWENLKRSAVTAGLSYEIEGKGLIQLWGNDGSHAVIGDKIAPRAQGDGSVEFNQKPRKPVGPHFDDAVDFGWTTGFGKPSGGSTTYDPGTGVYTQVGSGWNFGNSGFKFGDTGQFAYQRLTGDFDLTVEVLERQDPGVGDFGRYGLMARRDCSGNSRFSLLAEVIGAIPRRPSFRSRTTHGSGETTFSGGQTFPAPPDQRPNFMRLFRLGNSFYGFLSRDGKDWRPWGNETWQEQDPGEPILVGFTTHNHENFDRPGVVKFRVLHFGAVEPAWPKPIPPDGLSAGTEIFTSGFEDLAPWQIQHRDGKFDPVLREGWLRMIDLDQLGNSTSAFSKTLIDRIDGAVYQFDFDLRFARGKAGTPLGVPGDGLTFAILQGKETNRVGIAGGAMGYGGIALDPNPDPALKDQNIGTNSVAVEFDFWAAPQKFSSNEGLGSPGLPGRYHVGIDPGNFLNSVVQTSEGLPEAFKPDGLHVRVQYNRGLVGVSIGPKAGTTEGLRSILEAQVQPLSHLSPDQSAVFGFTAGTGAAAMTAEVDNLRVVRFDPIAPAPNWRRCDANGDNALDISDPIFSLTYQFNGGAAPGCPGALDCDGDGRIDISDPVLDISYQFLAGPAPPAPYPDCDLFPACEVICR